MKYTVTAPVAGFRGDLAGLVFRDGSAVADSVVDGAALAYCRRRGYTVEPLEDAPAREAAVEDVNDGGEVTRPKDYDAKPAWVDYAVAQGAVRDDAEQLTKPQLIEQYGSQEGTIQS